MLLLLQFHVNTDFACVIHHQSYKGLAFPHIISIVYIGFARRQSLVLSTIKQVCFSNMRDMAERYTLTFVGTFTSNFLPSSRYELHVTVSRNIPGLHVAG